MEVLRIIGIKILETEELLKVNWWLLILFFLGVCDILGYVLKIGFSLSRRMLLGESEMIRVFGVYVVDKKLEEIKC